MYWGVIRSANPCGYKDMHADSTLPAYPKTRASEYLDQTPIRG